MPTNLPYAALSDSWQIGSDGAAAFLAVCDRAAVSPDWAGFKRDPAFCRVLEHVTEEQGDRYLTAIRAERPDLLDHASQFAANDRLGDPHVFEFGAYHFSPTTLRYMRVLADLLVRFGSLDGFDIIEIGGGYGGQCKIIADVCRFGSYTLVDLPSPLRLQARYLTELGVTGWQCRRPEEIPDRDNDLVISNFALSELDPAAQDYYFERVLRRARRGYITWNCPSLPPLRCFPAGAEVVEECPNTGAKNRVVIWGQKAPEPAPCAPQLVAAEAAG